ncbi:MAG: hypothetical protein ACWA6X_13950 [Bauldia sp.]
MLFVLSQYWPFALGAALLGVAVGWWTASPAGGRRRGAGKRRQ